jgi:hypothetical protein
VIKETREEIRKFMEFNENKITTYQKDRLKTQKDIK